MTAADIETAIVRHHYRMSGQIAVPNVTALGHESDVLVLTARGYVLEIEIKVSLADFRADLRGAPLSPKWMRQEVMRAAAAREPLPRGWLRARHRGTTDWRPTPLYERLPSLTYAVAAPTCPNRFAYAYPEELHEAIKVEAPSWAGLFPIRQRGSFVGPRLDPRRSAMLHRQPAPPTIRDAMLLSAYHRFWRERHARIDAQRELEALRDRMNARAA